jgi:hypothetical protein
MYLAKMFIAPAIYLFINRYSQAAAHHSPIIYLSLKHSVKIHKEAGETLTHSVRLSPPSLVPSLFDCIDRHQHLFSVSRIPPCRPNQTGNIVGAALASRCPEDSGSLMPWSCSMSDSMSAVQSSSLSLGLYKSPFQLSQSSVSDMHSGALSSSLSTVRRFIVSIW